MYNQYLLTELIKVQARAEPTAKIRNALQEQGINIDDLVITGEISLYEVFDPSARYHRVERDIFREQEYADETLWLFDLHLVGNLNSSSFAVYIGHKDIFFPFMYEPTKAGLAVLEKVETYLRQRQQKTK